MLQGQAAGGGLCDGDAPHGGDGAGDDDNQEQRGHQAEAALLFLQDRALPVPTEGLGVRAHCLRVPVVARSPLLECSCLLELSVG